MNSDFIDLIGKKIEVEISGGFLHSGILIDCGLDIIVIYKHAGLSYLYIPIKHIQRLKETTIEEEDLLNKPSDIKPIETEEISFRKALTFAKGMFVEIYVTGKNSLHGYISVIMNDYIVFQSPVYKTLYISMNHIKWLVPYTSNKTPYSLAKENLPLVPHSNPIARIFERQMKKLENELVLINCGDHNEKIGVLQKVQNNHVTLITAEGEKIYRNIEHIKTIHLP